MATPNPNYDFPRPLHQQHAEFHQRLNNAARIGGEIGDAASTLVQLICPHFAKEEEFALPIFVMVQPLLQGEIAPEMAKVPRLTNHLEVELPALRVEHREIIAEIERLADAARRSGNNDIVEFTNALTLHVEMEVQVIYPAALLLGQFVRERLRILEAAKDFLSDWERRIC